eukprot:c27200_g1_i1 orf=2-1363(-)
MAMASPEGPVLYQGVVRASPAFRLLKQMGWEEGKGLGKDQQGITQHVKVKKKNDNAGIGVDVQQKAASNWAFNTTVFDNILKNLKVQIVDNAEGEPKKDALIVDDKVEKRLQSKKVARPQGRYKKRENGKLVHEYSQTDLRAILGNVEENATEELVCDRQPDHFLVELEERSVSISVKVSDTFCEGFSGTCMTEWEGSKDEDFAEEWWGKKHGFIRGGLLGERTQCNEKTLTDDRVETSDLNTGGWTAEVKREEPPIRSCFCEQDQEKLYNSVQAKATRGYQGLGTQEHSRKIGGPHSMGQKIILHNDDNADSEEQLILVLEEQQGPGFHQNPWASIEKSKRRLKRKELCEYHSEKNTRKLQKQKVVEECSEVLFNGREFDQSKPKWKTLCCQVLRQAPSHTMSIKHLLKHVTGDLSFMPTNSASDSEAALLFFRKKLQKSTRFLIRGSKVSLA